MTKIVQKTTRLPPSSPIQQRRWRRHTHTHNLYFFSLYIEDEKEREKQKRVMMAIVISDMGIGRGTERAREREREPWTRRKKNKVARESFIYKRMKMEPTNNCPDDEQMTSSSRDLFQYIQYSVSHVRYIYTRFLLHVCKCLTPFFTYMYI